jgi:hypothetical protein
MTSSVVTLEPVALEGLGLGLLLVEGWGVLEGLTILEEEAEEEAGFSDIFLGKLKVFGKSGLLDPLC